MLMNTTIKTQVDRRKNTIKTLEEHINEYLILIAVKMHHNSQIRTLRQTFWKVFNSAGSRQATWKWASDHI